MPARSRTPINRSHIPITPRPVCRPASRLALAALALAVLLAVTGPAGAGPEERLSIGGLVKQPLRLGPADLARFNQVEVKHNDIDQAGQFHGVFWLRGVSLRDLLETAQVGKESGGFHKSVDLAVLVRNRAGQQVALSWGEVFHRNPSETILAFASRPVRPVRDCKACHEPDVYKSWLSQLDRRVEYPKLVLSNDFFSDRSLEGVTSIEVVELTPGQWGPKPEKLFSPSFTLSLPGSKAKAYKKLPDLARRKVLANQVGQGKGFHGRRLYSGLPLADLLERGGAKGGLDTVVLVSAPDGYRSLVSWGELFLSPAEQDILLADRVEGKPIDRDGRFQLVLGGDLWADRWVKAVSDIQVVGLARRGQLYVIGVGCGDSNLLTLEAVSKLGRADALVAPGDIQKRFALYLAGKEVLFDPMPLGKKPFTAGGKHASAEQRQQRRQQQAKAAAVIKKALEQGKTVALLDWGDPMVYGSWRWLADFFPLDQIRFVPGLSAFNAGSAALGRDITCNGAVVISDPFTILAKPELLEDLAQKGATLAVFMGLPKFEQVMAAVGKAYDPQTPVTVVLRAGYNNGERVLRSQLAKIGQETGRIKEKWLGVIFVGPCLAKDRPAAPGK